MIYPDLKEINHSIGAICFLLPFYREQDIIIIQSEMQVIFDILSIIMTIIFISVQ